MRAVATMVASIALASAGELHEAARVCNADQMRQLLARHPSVNETDPNGMTPLHVAVDARKKACVWLLLDAGADRLARDGQGRTPMDAADKIADGQDRGAIGHMLKNFGQPTGPMPWSLEYSVMRRQTSVTKMLLALGVDPNAPGSGGTMPLADAALKGNVEAVRALLEHGARPDAVNQAGTQPIHDAALGDSAEVIKELVMRGVDVNARTRDEAQTPLHIAASMGKMKAAEALVAQGADLSLRDSKGRTALDTAERVGLTEMGALLKRASAVK